ncbi:MAG: metallophosphoesterase, partial [Pseudomonadota bacterium]
DSGTADSNAAAVRDAYKNFNGSRYTDLLLMLGDNAYDNGTDSEYQKAVFNMYPEVLRQTPLWPTLGNHDARSADSSSLSGVYYSLFHLPRNAEAGGVPSGTEAYYSFDYDNIHFICLDSMDTSRSKTGSMMTWLKNDLAANDKDWTIAFWHHPPYSKGSHNSDSETAMIQMRENALPILESYGVDLVLTGHSHSYERSYLLDGHYGKSSTLTSGMILDNGDGREDGDGAYFKTQLGPLPHDGAVYVVAGSSGKLRDGPLNHPAMVVSTITLGSVVLDISDGRLDAKFIDTSGKFRDYFTIEKGDDTLPPVIDSASAVNKNTVRVQFSEQMQSANANKVSSYTIDQGVSVEVAALASDGLSVTLTTSALSDGVTHTIKASNLKDLAGNVIVSGTQAKFTYTAPAPVWEGRVADGNHDSEETTSSGRISLTSDDLELAYLGSGAQTAAVCFTNVGIPQGVTITKAYVQFQADETDSSAVSMNMQGEFSGDAAPLTSASFDLSSRPRTNAKVGWKPDPWTAVGEAGPAQRTTDISPIIQEIVDNPNWAAGNAMAIMFDNVSGSTGKRTAESYNGSSGGAPLLHIEFAEGGSPAPANQPPTVTINEPAGGAAFVEGQSITFDEGESITFAGNASDPEDGDLTAKMSWVSDVDGVIGTGGTVTTSKLSAGTHRVTASATDSNGAESSSEVVVDVVAVGGGSPVEMIWEGRVKTGNDDAEEKLSTGRISVTSSDLEMAYISSPQISGVRFTNVEIPKGAKITKAYLQFKADETDTSSVTLRIRGENSANAAMFSTTSGDITRRAVTSASATWSPEAWTKTGEAGLPQRTSDIATVVQQLVNRSDWASGNAMVFLIDNPTGGSGKRTAESYNGDASGASLLHIHYVN